MAANTTKDAFSFSATAFDPAKVTETFRDFAEKGAAQSKDAYADEDRTEGLPRPSNTLQTAQAGTAELGLTIDAHQCEMSSLRKPCSAAVDRLTIEPQTSFIRKQAEVNIEQGWPCRKPPRSCC
jgi:hypothetical protein